MKTIQPKPEGLSMARQTAPIDKEIGQRIKRLRREARLSQNNLAQAIGVTFQQVQKYESGKNRLSVAMLLNISKALHCSVETLLGSDESGVLTQAERNILTRWHNLPSDKHRETIHTLMGWLDEVTTRNPQR